MVTQYHLKGRGFSGRAVRVRSLEPFEIEQNLLAAAKLVSKEASIIELKKVEWRNGVKLMVTELSEPCENALASDVKWKKLSAGALDDLGAYFTAKDSLALEAIYRNDNEVVQSEIDDITGKAVPVSEG